MNTYKVFGYEDGGSGTSDPITSQCPGPHLAANASQGYIIQFSPAASASFYWSWSPPPRPPVTQHNLGNQVCNLLGSLHGGSHIIGFMFSWYNRAGGPVPFLT